jgi:glucose/arabinose dehydrogenase
MRSFLLLSAFSLFLLQCSSSELDNRRQPSGTSVLDTSGYLYDPNDRSCDGFPRLQVQTMPGTCLGLVLPQKRAVSEDKPWRFPRTLLEIPGSKDFLAIDMGGWAQNRGALYLLRANGNGVVENVLLKDKLNMPHALRLGPDGRIYIGETDKIVRFRFIDGKIRDWEVVVSPLMKFKGYMHPLVQLAFDPRNGDLYVNAGSGSDHCIVKDHGGYSDCPEDTESGYGAIYRVPAAKLAKVPPGGIRQYEVSAQGLRNSMAMVVHPSGWLVQGENGRDFPQLEEPYEEMNAIDLADTARGKHYGWPYCFDFHAVSPEWKFSQNGNDPLRKRFNARVDCSAKAGGIGEYQPPHILFPPHVAPLHFDYYRSNGQLAALLKGKLIATWHGYQPGGQRLVAYKVDARGLPVTESALSGKETYGFNIKGGCAVRKPFRPEGGLDRFAHYEEIISQWNDVKGVRPKGSPVSFYEAQDGSLWIAEDKNRTVVRLARSDRALTDECGGGGVVAPTTDPRIELLAWRKQLESQPEAKAAYEKVRSGILVKYCASCHGGFVEKDIAQDGYAQLDFLVRNEFFVPRNAPSSKIWQALAHTGEVPAMPPADIAFPEGRDAASLVESVKTFIELLPADLVKNSVKRTSMKESRKIRDAAGGKECGQMSPGDVVYIDPRAETQVKQGGWLWTRVFMIPGDSRLFKGACAYPVDGVYYMGVSKL